MCSKEVLKKNQPFNKIDFSQITSRFSLMIYNEIMKFIINLLINGFAVFIAAYLLPGIKIDSFITAIIVSIGLGIVNTLIRPILLLFTLPLTLVTFGLFIFIINGLLVLLVSTFVPGFKVQSFFWAMAFSAVLWAVNFVFHSLTK